MRVIAVVSPLGGVGRTTLTAHLATLLARQGQRSLAVELCAQNLLGRHLGMHEASAAGWARAAADGQWWAEGGFDNSDGVRVLPFGEASLETIHTLHQLLQVQPRWLQDQIEALKVDGRWHAVARGVPGSSAPSTGSPTSPTSPTSTPTWSAMPCRPIPWSSTAIRRWAAGPAPSPPQTRAIRVRAAGPARKKPNAAST